MTQTKTQTKTWAQIAEADIAACEKHGDPSIRMAGSLLRQADAFQNRGDIRATKTPVADAAFRLNHAKYAPFYIRY